MSLKATVSELNAEDTPYESTPEEIKNITEGLLCIVDFDLYLIEDELEERHESGQQEIILDLNNPFSVPFGIPEEAKKELELLLSERGYRVLAFTPDPAIRIIKK